MSMGFMVAMAGRKRDERGRYMDGDGENRMNGDYGRMNDSPEMRRRRDSRGRYMDGGEDSRMEYEGNQGRYGRMEQVGGSAHYWPEPHIPPYLNRPESRDDRRMNDRPYEMRDRNIVNIRDYQDRRNIGFRQNRMEDDEDEEELEMRQYGRRYEPDRPKMHHGSERRQEHTMGHSEGHGGGEHLTREEAEEWVDGMHGADGSKGGRWKLPEIKQYAGNFGIQGEEKIIEFFAVMNAMYTDYCKVAKKFGVDKVEFYADLAKAFMDDKDAMPGKVKTYFECIAMKGEE